jgi:hypothetical protein
MSRIRPARLRRDLSRHGRGDRPPARGDTRGDRPRRWPRPRARRPNGPRPARWTAPASCAAPPTSSATGPRSWRELETLDTGKPIQETRVADWPSGADALEFSRGWPPRSPARPSRWAAISSIRSANRWASASASARGITPARSPAGKAAPRWPWQCDGVQTVRGHAAGCAATGRDPDRGGPACGPVQRGAGRGAVGARWSPTRAWPRCR